MRVRFIKDTRNNKAGDIAEVSKNVAFGLIDSGFAVVSKDLTAQDYKIKKRRKL